MSKIEQQCVMMIVQSILQRKDKNYLVRLNGNFFRIKVTNPLAK